jgi:hypothetical protein
MSVPELSPSSSGSFWLPRSGNESQSATAQYPRHGYAAPPFDVEICACTWSHQFFVPYVFPVSPPPSHVPSSLSAVALSTMS